MSATSDAVKGILGRLPQLAARVAAKAAPRLAQRAQSAFDARTSPYGMPWGTGSDGRPITLRQSGALRAAALGYRAVATKIRSTVTSVRYAKYHIRRGILPRGGQALPAAWEGDIRQMAVAEFKAISGGSS